MSDKSPIEWTDATWNPIVGCDHVSAGCDHCYAATQHNHRFLAWKRGRWPDAPEQYHKPFWTGPGHVQLFPERLDQPRRWRKPRMVFTNSVSDPFHPDVPGEFFNEMWMQMFNVKRHTYQILTKRPERLRGWTERKAAATQWPIEDIWPSWMWIGTSVEHQDAATDRLFYLTTTPAKVHMVSFEPLLGMVDVSQWLGLTLLAPNLRPYPSVRYAPVKAAQLQWAIIGGESGDHARPMDLAWARLLIEQCRAAGVPVFVKQLGDVWAKENHAKNRHGRDMSEWPEDLRIREFPATAQAVQS